MQKSEMEEMNCPATSVPPSPTIPKQLLSNEKVKAVLQKMNPIPLSQLPANANASSLLSRFYDGQKIGLPNGWLIEQRPRITPKYVGKVDQFFYEPKTGKQFRSLKAVLEYLGVMKLATETAMAVQSNAESSSSQQPNSTISWKMRKRNKKKKEKSFHFDFGKAPESITWALTDADTNEWSAFADELGVPDDLKCHWTQIFLSINNVTNHA